MKEADGNTGAVFSILDPQARHYPDRPEIPAYFRDLNLETVLDWLAAKGGRSVRKYYRRLPETAEAEAYRRAVYADVKTEAVYATLTAFTERLADADRLRREREKVSDGLQQAMWLLREAEVYCRACEGLGEALETAALSSGGMKRFRNHLRDTLRGDAFGVLRMQVYAIMDVIRGLRLVITYEKDRIRVSPGEVSGEYEVLPEQAQKPLQNPFSANPALTELERSCLEILRKKRPALFREILAVSRRFGAYEEPVIARFAEEIRFYLAFRAFQLEMAEKGFALAAPTVSDALPLRAEGLYDLALACVSVGTGRKVVANDFRYEGSERFFVLTGPNQGGKTTFARSLGQLVYLARIGLDVPAREANVPFFPDIQTHFSVEESMETGRGKLKEELVRLAPMMDEKRKGTFVVINELFTTAANYDAQIMGRKVLEHFIGLGCTGIYVTHLKELASAHPQVTSLAAMADENGIPTYEIRRGDAPESAGADNLLNKHRLSYAQLKERL